MRELESGQRSSTTIATFIEAPEPAKAVAEQLGRFPQFCSAEGSGLELEFGEANEARILEVSSLSLASAISISAVPLNAEISQESR